MMLELASCDPQGHVYIGTSNVYRVINPAFLDQTIRMVELVGNRIDGLIDVSLCDAELIPEELRKFNNFTLTLKHKKIPFISYPHEWCAEMLRDSAIFHLKLSGDLLKIGIYIKDAHPWNILFDHGSPVFIDFTSLVLIDDLFEEPYLEANKYFRHSSIKKRTAKLISEIYIRMFRPYFLNPLLFYRFGNRDYVRLSIENSTLNVHTNIISLSDFLPRDKAFLVRIKKQIALFKILCDESVAHWNLGRNKDVPYFLRRMTAITKSAVVTCGGTPYLEYYKNKGEDVTWEYSEGWNQKQKILHDTLKNPEITTVLDVACNTGWYSLMAEKLGKKVVAFDIDEGCVEELYSKVKKGGLDILPLVMNFTQLTSDKYSMYDEKKVIISAETRLQSDCVMALGILHHLVLGVGMSFNEVLSPLIRLTKKWLIIEYVESEDPVIVNEPEFFSAYSRDKGVMGQYNLESLINLIEDFGFDVSLVDSFPGTRKILVCNAKSL
jgi:SAM-dependent methyltransferase